MREGWSPLSSFPKQIFGFTSTEIFHSDFRRAYLFISMPGPTQMTRNEGKRAYGLAFVAPTLRHHSYTHNSITTIPVHLTHYQRSHPPSGFYPTVNYLYSDDFYVAYFISNSSRPCMCFYMIHQLKLLRLHATN